jgi:hypothetical protein
MKEGTLGPSDKPRAMLVLPTTGMNLAVRDLTRQRCPLR